MLFLFLFFLVVLSAPLTAQVDFSYHSKYSYLKGKDANSIGSGWMNVGFNYSDWTTGTAPFRYGDGVSGVELTDMQNNYSTVYLRSSFECLNASIIKNLVLSVDYDDGFVLWINGVQALSKNAPSNLSYNSFAPANHESGTGEAFTISTTNLNLTDGTNYIALQCFNVSLSSTDFYFDLSIKGETDIPEVQDTNGISYNIRSGFFSAPFDVILTAPDNSAQIIYTLDGSNPQDSKSSIVSGSPLSVRIDPASIVGRPATPAVILRASIIKPGFKASKPTFRTFIFMEKVKKQIFPGGGWPDTDINGQIIDLAIDTLVVKNPAYAAGFNNSLAGIPSISLITDIRNLFDPASGIYVNADGHGLNWEKECSVELIQPDGSVGFNINAGLRIRGGWSRHDTYPKHSFRLFFREVYGSAKLDFPLFGEEGVSLFDKIDLRSEQNYAWNNGLINNSFVRDVFSRDTQRDMGQPYTRSRYYHLYLNGMYWGLYQTQERSEARFAASYLGGNDDDYDVIKVNTDNWGHVIEATDGNLVNWQKIWNMCLSGFKSDASYFALEGKNSDGKPIKGGEVLVNIDNLIDYMLVIFYTGNFDAPASSFSKNKFCNNFYAIDNRVDKSKGFTFYAHDSEHSLFDEAHSPGIGLNEDRVNLGTRTDQMKMEISDFSYFHPQWLHYKLTANKEYRVRFANRAYNQFQKGGVFSQESSLKRINKRIAEVDIAVIAESARWGDAKRGTAKAYTRNDQWIPEINRIRTKFIPFRSNFVISQLQDADLYPVLLAPQFKSADSLLGSKNIMLNSPISLEIINPNKSGMIYYTVNGTDPRQTGGEIFRGSIFSNTNLKLSFRESNVIKARIYDNGEWSAMKEINIIYEKEDYSDLKITEIHYHPKDYIVGTDTVDGKDLEFIEFKNTGNHSLNLSGLELDSAIHYVFPENVLIPPRGFFVIASSPVHFYDYYGLIASGNYHGNLSNGGEEILLKDSEGKAVINFVYEDSAPWPGSTDGYGYSLSSVDSNPEGDPANYSYWTNSSEIGGTPFADNKLTDPGNESNRDNPVVVYPNPTNGNLNILIKTDDETGQYELKLSDLTGRQVYGVITGRQAVLNLNQLGLQSGIYILGVKSESINIRSRIIFVK